MKDERLLGSRILLLLRFLRCADPEIVADGAADVLFPLLSAVPLGLAGPIYLARFTAVHLWAMHKILLPFAFKIHHIDILVNIIVAKDVSLVEKI